VQVRPIREIKDHSALMPMNRFSVEGRRVRSGCEIPLGQELTVLE